MPFISPIALIVALVVDVVTRTPRLRRTRGVALVSGLIVVDAVGRVLIFGNWVISPFGTNVWGIKSQRRLRWLMTWWASTMMRVISRITPLPIDTSELDESLLGGNAIVIGRHRSFLDALVPASLFGQRGLTTLYTMKEELRWEPNLDIVGQRMGHVFVSRSPDDLEAELAPIRELGARIGEKVNGVIFPEGTFFSPERKARALASIAEKNPERIPWSETMDYVLPPRPAGTVAFLEGAPDADVIMLGHVGFEPFGTLKEIAANMGATHSIRLKAWRYPRSEVPTDRDDLIEWLFAKWNELDDWIASHHPLAGYEIATADTPENIDLRYPSAENATAETGEQNVQSWGV